MSIKSTTLEELKNALIKNGRRHRWYFHYTTSSVLGKMLKSNQLWLSSLERMNDGTEARLSIAKRTFSASFSYGSEESVAMWNTYGIPRREAVRLCFDGVLFRRWMDANPTSGRYLAIDANGEVIEELPIDVIEVSLQDIAYSSGKKGKVIHNRSNPFTIVDEKGKAIKSSSNKLASYVKKGGWSYEKEVRLVIRIADGYNVPDLTHVAVDFSSVIQCLRGRKTIQQVHPITLSPWASSLSLKEWRKQGFCVCKSSFTGFLDNLKTICDKCDDKTKACCKCKHKSAR